MKRHRKQQSQVLSEVENYHIDNILSGEFKDMYKNVQFNLRDFRNNIFSKNIDILDENVVNKFIVIYTYIYIYIHIESLSS
jgi:hypothetical protein